MATQTGTHRRRIDAGLCIRCGETKPIAGIQACENCRNNLRRPEAKSSSRRSRLKRHYGLSEKQFDAMLEEQNGQCAICGFQFHDDGGQDSRPHVDHDHKTGRTRALLCGPCNRTLGHALKDPARLLNCITYLQHFEVTDGK